MRTGSSARASGRGACPRRSRRGSFLVLVVGVLALLAVIAILYAAIGSTDRQRAGAVVRNAELNQYPTRVAEYISTIIGDDVLDVYYDRAPAGVSANFRLMHREGWDAPGIDWNFVSDAGAVNDGNAGTPSSQIRRLFSPSGGYRRTAYSTNQDPFEWFPCDPFLASSAPAWLNAANGALPNGATSFTATVDWPMISNIAPDGRFVNLWNLRNNYDAESGFGQDTLTGKYRISANLTLLAPNQVDHSAPVTNATLQLDAGGNATLDANYRPAHFTARQASLYRPAVDLRPHQNAGPGGRHWLNYQYADADGDGYFDSRWAELRAGFRQGAAGSYEAVDVVPRDPDVRYFVAARITDLSSLVNANTASDFLREPDSFRLAGSSPSEVDLRRILMMADAPLATGGGTYNDIYNPAGSGYEDYASSFFGYNTWSQDAGHYGYVALKLAIATGTLPADGYSAGRLSQTGGFAFLYGVGSQDGSLAQASWDFISSMPTLTNTSAAQPFATTPAMARARAYEALAGGVGGGLAAGSFGASGAVGVRRVFGLEDELELRVYHGVNNAGVSSALEAAVGGRASALQAPVIQPSPHSPLRDNRSARLERVGEAMPLSRQDLDRFMLLNAIDPRRLITTVSGTRLGVHSATAIAGLPANPAGAGVVDPALRAAMDSITPSELRADAMELLDRANEYRVDHGRQRVDSDPQGRAANVAIADQAIRLHDSAMNGIVGAYFSALAPFACLPDAWANPAMRTLAYGHRGPELALLASAHMAANLRDLSDADDKPTARTLLVDEGLRASFLDAQDRQDFTNSPRGDSLYPWWHCGKDLDVHGGVATAPNRQNSPALNPAARLADQNRGDATLIQAINVFGVEAMPFITGVALFTVYTDTPDDRGGDNDTVVGGINGTDHAPVTVRTDLTVTGDGTGNDNEDFLFRCLAFQLTNPFNVDITLGDAGWNGYDVGDRTFPAVTRMGDYSYITFGGRTFALLGLKEEGTPDSNATDDPDAVEYPSTFSAGIGVGLRTITIPAGKSVVVYALSQIPRKIHERLVRSSGDDDAEIRGAAPTNRFVRQIIRGHLASTVVTGTTRRFTDEVAGMYWIPEIGQDGRLGMQQDPAGATQQATDFKYFADGGADAGENCFGQLVAPRGGWADTDAPGDEDTLGDANDTRVARLWRVLRAGLEPAYDAVGNPVATSVNPTARGTKEAEIDPGFTFPGVRPTVEPADATAKPDVRRLANLARNDVLVDRFRLPAVGTGAQPIDLNVRLASSGVAVNGFSPPANNVFIEGTDSTDDGDQNGLTITMWKAARRPADANGEDAIGSSPRIPRGAIPFYCLESKRARFPGAGWWNLGRRDDATLRNPTLNKLDKLDFAASPATANFGWQGGYTFKLWREGLRGADRQPMLARSVARGPQRQEAVGGSDEDVRARNNPTLGDSATGVPRPFEVFYPEVALRNDYFRVNSSSTPSNAGTLRPNAALERNLRVVDMLQPLAIGPFHDPQASFPQEWRGTGLTLEDVQRHTLSEALALSIGYEGAFPPPSGTLPNPPRLDAPLSTVYNLIWPELPSASAPITTAPYPFDRGRLVLDAYPPFVDANGDGVFTTGPAGDVRYGLQSPLALNVLDAFSARPVARDPSKDKLWPGYINASTAPVQVLRAVPMLSPAVHVDPTTMAPVPDNPLSSDYGANPISFPVSGDARGGEVWWWQDPTTYASIPAPTSTTYLNPQSDVAATLVAYRDRLRVPYRIGSDNVDPVFAVPEADFTPVGATLPGEANDVGRQNSTFIVGLGENPGLRSPGEIMNARFRTNQGAAAETPIERSAALPGNIDHLGFAFDRNGTAASRPVVFRQDSSVPGVSFGSHWYDNTTGTGPARLRGPNTIRNDYDEKLAVAGGALGSLSTRSDVFAAWFVVHGYRRADVENLRDEQPMAPSIKRRFLVIYDRSNVVRRGQQARILLFKELPL